MEESRYYVTSVEYNKVAKAENRTVPFSFATIDEARKKFAAILSQDILNPTLSWCNIVMWDSYGNTIMHDFWHEKEQEKEQENI